MAKKTKKINNIQNKTKKNIKMDIVVYKTPFESFEKKVEKKDLVRINNKTKLRDKEFLHFMKEKKTINPKEDYYNYINNYWNKDILLTKKERYLTEINDITLVQNKVFHQINDIYSDIITKMSVKEVINMRTFYNAAYKLNLPIQSKENVIESIELIDNFRKYSLKNNLWKFLATINKNSLVTTLCPIRFRMDANEKDYKHYCPYIHPLMIPLDHVFFINDNTNIEYKERVRELYKKFIDDLCSQSIGTHHNINSQDVLDVFMDIEMCFKEKDNTYNHNTSYNIISKENSSLLYDFNWEEFTKELGFLKTPDFFVTTNVNYFKNITSLLLKEWNSEKWRSYWIFIYIIQISKFTRGWKKLIFDVENGSSHNNSNNGITDEIYAINLTLISYNHLLTKLYKEKYYNQDGIFYVENLSNDLKVLFYFIVQNNKWLDKETKQKALLKIKNINISIGNYKEKQKSYEDPDLNYTNNVWLNLTNYVLWRFNQYLELNGKEIVNFPIIDWNTNNTISFKSNEDFILQINYSPLSNTLFIPLSIIQKPFLDLEEAGFEYNLAYLGFKIASVLSSSIVDKGSEYDHTGNFNVWWTKNDYTNYEMIKEEIKKQYENSIKRDNIKLTNHINILIKNKINETANYIAAIYMCQKYVLNFHDIKQLPNIVRKVRIPEFYAFYTNQMKQTNINKKEKEFSFSKYISNIPLTRLDIFKSLYNVTKDDGMYWRKDAKIW